MKKYLIGAALATCIWSATSLAVNDTFHYCPVKLKNFDDYSNQPIKEANSLSEKYAGKTIITTVAYLRRGDPAAQLAWSHVTKNGIFLYTIHNFNNEKTVAITISTILATHQIVTIRAAGTLKLVPYPHPCFTFEYKKNNRRKERPEHYYKYLVQPTWMKFTYSCRPPLNSKLDRSFDELTYFYKDNAWQKTHAGETYGHVVPNCSPAHYN